MTDIAALAALIEPEARALGFDLVRVAPDQAGDHMVLKVAHHRQLTPVHGGVADTREAFIGFDLPGHDIAAGAADADFSAGDF